MSAGSVQVEVADRIIGGEIGGAQAVTEEP